ncbi:hypothetical protein [Spiroplasma endosymbiont of Virgichneumon dumeticola]|uniref:hypothetical protein n=1 Tax=Spiroplasma endosymbiont of Virgichneumon dumeticola TaxID=3139323 RepID=UPI0035C8FFA8
MSNPLNINFDSYDQIINNDWNLATNDNNIINKQGYLQTQQRITNNISNFKNGAGFTNTNLTTFGHTFNSKNQSIIIPYHETINESINQGLFEVINEKSKLNTLMEVPYILTPSTTFQNNDISMRAKIFPIGPVNNGEDTISNQLFVFYVHAPFLKNNKGLNITVAGQPSIAIKTNASNTFSYAILNQQYNANNTPTNYDIKWKDNDNITILQEEKVKVISSTPTVNIGNNNEYINNSSLIHQYFVKNNSSDITVKALSQIKNQVSISFNENEHWTYQAVNDDLTPVAATNTLNNNSTLKPRDDAYHTIYLLQRTTSDNKIDPESQQYLNVYTINPLLLTINGYSDFATSNLGHAFAQYLR